MTHSVQTVFITQLFFNLCNETTRLNSNNSRPLGQKFVLRVSSGIQTPRNSESTRPLASCFHLILGVWTPWWNTRTCFWYITWKMVRLPFFKLFQRTATFFSVPWPNMLITYLKTNFRASLPTDTAPVSEGRSGGGGRGGSMLPSKIALCSYVPTNFPYLFNF